MTDRIDTDAIRDEALIADRPGQCDRLTALADGVDEEMVRLHAVIADRDRLLGRALDEVDRLRGLADPAPVGLSQAGYTDEAIGPNEARMIAERLAAQAVVRRAVNRLEPHLGCVTCRRPLDNGWCGWCDPKSEPDRDVTTHTCARCGQLYDPSLHHACLDGSTARSILSSALTGTRPYDQAGAAIKKLADHGYSIVPTPCRHSIYHHGCPSCDRQDPEDR